MNKEKLTAYIKDIKLKQIIIKNLSKVEGVLLHHDIRHTDFLNPLQRQNFVGILKGEYNISHRECAPGSSNERAILQIFPQYMNENDIELPYDIIKVYGNYKFNDIRHKDYLGALLSLGISREKIGDIHVHEDCAYLICDKSLSSFIQFNLNSIGRVSIKLKNVSIQDFQEAIPTYKEIIINIASRRIDAVISEIYNISRSKASDYINNERLSVNFELINSCSKEIKDGSMISLKGYGRAIFCEVISETKKGRFRARVNILS